MPSSHLILCRPLLLLPPIPPSITVYSNESTLRMRWPKYWSFSFSISPSNEHPGLTSFNMDWFDLLAVQGTLKSLQHHSLKASILQCYCVGYINIYCCYVSFLDWSLDQYVISFLISCNLILYFKVYFIWYENWCSTFLLISIFMEYLFPSSHFQFVCVSRSEVGFLWIVYTWVSFLYPSIQSVSFGWMV